MPNLDLIDPIPDDKGLPENFMAEVRRLAEENILHAVSFERGRKVIHLAKFLASLERDLDRYFEYMKFKLDAGQVSRFVWVLMCGLECEMSRTERFRGVDVSYRKELRKDDVPVQ